MVVLWFCGTIGLVRGVDGIVEGDDLGVVGQGVVVEIVQSYMLIVDAGIDHSHGHPLTCESLVPDLGHVVFGDCLVQHNLNGSVEGEEDNAWYLQEFIDPLHRHGPRNDVYPVEAPAGPEVN